MRAQGSTVHLLGITERTQSQRYEPYLKQSCIFNWILFLYIGGIGIIRADKNEMTDKIIKVNLFF